MPLAKGTQLGGGSHTTIRPLEMLRRDCSWDEFFGPAKMGVDNTRPDGCLPSERGRRSSSTPARTPAGTATSTATATETATPTFTPTPEPEVETTTTIDCTYDALYRLAAADRGR